MRSPALVRHINTLTGLPKIMSTRGSESGG
jgi:hypothetical protein